jgi:di/tricarboxylate transporter
MSQLTQVLLLLGAAVAMFALNRPRMDVVGLIMMTALPLTGVLTMGEALAGLADPNVVLIAALFVIGEALVRTGVAQRLGDWLAVRARTSEARLVALLMAATAGMGSFMSSTGVVAIFIPIVLRIAQTAKIPAGRLMMPLSVAALVSGMMTLVGTAPNLVVHAELTRQGQEGFGFFSFTPFGLPILAVAVLYMLVARRFLNSGAATAPSRRVGLLNWIEEYGLSGRERRLRIRPGSPLAGTRLDALDLRASAGINIIAIARDARWGRKLIQPQADTVLAGGDILMLDLRRDSLDLQDFVRANALDEIPASGQWFTDAAQEIGMAQLIVPPTSRLVGRTVVEARFRTTYGLAVIGIKHGSQPVAGDLLSERVRVGDTLLVVGRWNAIRRVHADRSDLVLLDLPTESDDTLPERHRAPLALAVLALVVVLMGSGVVPNVQAALLGCLLLGLFRCIDMPAAYRSIHWQSLILIAGMLPFSLALQRTGGVELAARALLDALGGADPRLLLAALFAATAGLGLFISNTATAVLMAPVALAVAGELDLNPQPFAMTVALAASAAFMTPVSSPVNTLVVGPGGYRFMDFVRIGVPLALLSLITSVALVPLLLPF